MKIIITGATGFIGSACVKHCLSHPEVTSVVTLTRRPLSESRAKDIINLSDPKLVQIVQQDLSSFSEQVITKLDGADACIWSLGTLPSKHNETVTAASSLEIPRAAVKAWNGTLQPSSGQPFRLVYVSAFLVNRDQNQSSSLIMGDFGKMRGETENIFAAQEEQTPQTWKAFLLKTGHVWAANRSLLSAVLPWYTIRVEEAAACMVDLALHGSSKQTLSNDEMKTIGKKALASLQQ